MSRTISVVIRCVNSKHSFKAFFEEQQPKQWYGVRTEKIIPPSFLERMLKKTQLMQMPDVPSDSNTEKEESSVTGSFYNGTNQCPYCGNTGFVRCGKCHKWNCHKDGVKQFHCALCGNTGEITGVIDSASGDLSQGDDEATSTLLDLS